MNSENVNRGMMFIFCIAINAMTLKFSVQADNRDERMVKAGIKKGRMKEILAFVEWWKLRPGLIHRPSCLLSHYSFFFCFYWVFSFSPFGAETLKAHHEVYRRVRPLVSDVKCSVGRAVLREICLRKSAKKSVFRNSDNLSTAVYFQQHNVQYLQL